MFCAALCRNKGLVRIGLPEKVVAVGAERGLLEEGGNELVSHRLVHLGMLDGATTLGNASVEAGSRSRIWIQRISQ